MRILRLAPLATLLTIITSSCGGRSDSVGPSVPSQLETWLETQPRIKAALVLDDGDGRGALAYSQWSVADKAELDRAFSDLESGTLSTMADPPANVVANLLPGSGSAVTALSKAEGRALYFGYVARSLLLEKTNALPWSIADYSAAELTILLDSRSFFVWKPNVAGTNVAGYVLYDSNVADRVTFDPLSVVSWVVPASVQTVASFLTTNNIAGSTRLETITRLLEWERTNLVHFSETFTMANAFAHWQYRGAPPVSRILAGTTNQALTPATFGHWTAGCSGTNSFMIAVLRALNIPVQYVVVDEHTTPSFPTEGMYLSHGDDPYTRTWSRSTPTVPASELLVDRLTYQMWFSPLIPATQRLANIGRRTRELSVKHLTDAILLRRCADIQAGSSDHQTSSVYAHLRTTYTLAELEALDLWPRLDAKIASRGGCSAIPPL